MTVEIELTTNHQGHMTLKLCPINDNNKVTTDECFDKYPLYLVDDNSTATYVIPGNFSTQAQNFIFTLYLTVEVLN